MVLNEKVKLDYIIIPNNHFKSEKKVSQERNKIFLRKK